MLRPRFRYLRNCSEVDAAPPIQISEELFRSRYYAPDSDIRGTVQKSLLRLRFRYPRNCSEVDATPPIQISEELIRSRCYAQDSDIRGTVQKSMLRPRFRYPRNWSEVDATPKIQISEELFRSRCPDSDIRGSVQKSMLRPRFRYPRNCSEVDAAPPIQIFEELVRSRYCVPDSDIRGTVQKSMLRPWFRYPRNCSEVDAAPRFRYPRNCSEVDATPPIQISEELFRSRCYAPDSDIRGTVQKSMLRPRFRYPRNCSEVDAAPRFRYPRNCSEVDATPPIQISEELFRSRCCAPIQISEELFRSRCYASDSDIRGTVQKSMLRPRFRYPRNCSEVDATPPIQISEELFRSRCCAPIQISEELFRSRCYAPDSDIRGTVQKSMLRPRFRYPRNCSEVDAPPPIQISELGLVVKHGDDARVRLDQDRSFLDDVELFRLATPRTHAVDAADQAWDQVVDGVHRRFSLAEEEGMVRERYERHRLTERIPSLSERHVAHLSEVNPYSGLVARSTNDTCHLRIRTQYMKMGIGGSWITNNKFQFVKKSPETFYVTFHSSWTSTVIISITSQVSDVKSLALRVTSINLVSLERVSIVEHYLPWFQLGKLDLGVTWPWFWRSWIFFKNVP